MDSGLEPGRVAILHSRVTESEKIIRREIETCGAMAFERFMELALYAPGAGYYEQPDRDIGRSGDFYTSVSVGPLFGFLLASRISAWMADWEGVDVLEAGAHDGQLAHDILTSLSEHFPDVASRVRYHLIEPSEVRRQRQRRRLEGQGERVVWHESIDSRSLPQGGVFLANELLDAFPVRRFEWEAVPGRWRESGVELSEGRLRWCRLEPRAGFCSPGSEEWKGILEDGWVCEQSPRAVEWWGRLAERLQRGWLVTFDYGHDALWGLRPERPTGSLRSYRGHRLGDSLLDLPGEQDLTAHVDFGALRRVAESSGWRTETYELQGRCLGRWAAEVIRAGGSRAAWVQTQARALQTLTHPVHLGSSFRALVQSRDGSSPETSRIAAEGGSR